MKPVIYLLIFLVLVSLVSAAQFKAAEEIIIDKPLYDNLYGAAGSIKILDRVVGDFIGAAGSIDVDNDIYGDLAIAGGDINLNGKVNGDVRAAAGNININGNIGRDFVGSGGNININGIIENDLVVSAGNINIKGTINGNADIHAGKITITGIIGQNARIIADEIVIGPDAQINGNLDYDADMIDFSEGNVKGVVTIIEQSPSKILPRVFGQIIYMILLFITGVLMIAIFKKSTPKVVKKISENTFLAAGIGFLILIAVPIASLILIITIIGIPFAILLLLAYGVAIFLGTVYVAISIGTPLLRKKKSIYLKLLVGVFLYGVVVSLPIMGGLVCFVGVIVGLGGLYLGFKK